MSLFSSTDITTCVEDGRQQNVRQNSNNTYSVKYILILNLGFFSFHVGVQIFIKSKETGMWCRGTITKLIPVKSKKEEKPSDPIRYKVCDVAVMEVFLIDVGSSEVLIFSGYVHKELFLCMCPLRVDT